VTGLDLSPWRASRDYRLMWSSGAISLLGTMVTFVAVPLQIKQLTDSSVAVGAMGLVELAPMIVFGLYGGALADAVDRGRIVLLAEIGLGLLSLLLVVNSQLPHPTLWLVYVVGAGAAGLDGVQRPALEALMPRIVPREHMTAAIALSSLRFSVGSIVGPAIGGLIAATFGVSAAYSCDLLSFVVAISLLARLRAAPPPSDADKPSLRGILEGLRYAGSRPELLGTYLVDIAAMLLAMPNAVFPFLADELGAPWALGMMYAATSVGGLAVTLTSGWMSRVHRHGLMVALAAGAWGLAMAGAGWSRPVWLVLLLLTLAGAADCVSGLFRMTMWNTTIPDNLRGRLAGIELLSCTAGPQLSQIRAGGVAALVGVRASIWTGGLACVAAVLCSTGLAGFIRYDERTWPKGQGSAAPADRG
jgi:MFS family permease